MILICVSFETVKRVHISNELFTADNGLLTPTFKLKRKEATIKYRKELDNLYVSNL
jgi:long-chain acyl-CoA synthetase